MSREERNSIGFKVALITEFAARFSMSVSQAYSYLKRFGGMVYMDEFYDVLHTQSFPDVVEAMARVCSKSGGYVR